MMNRTLYTQQVGQLKPRDGFADETKALLLSKAALLEKEENILINKRLKIIIAAAVITLLLTGTVFAAALLLSPSELAGRLGDSALAQAFESDDAVIVNQSIQSEGYTITFLGMVSGESINGIYAEAQHPLTYAAFAITRDDGSEINQADGCPVSLTPLVSGYQPWCVNLFSLSNGAYGYVENNVYYYLFSCSSLELFADREVAIFAYSGFAPSAGVFAMDEATGQIAYADGYSGIRAVFELQLDKSKADPAAAQSLLEDVGYEFNPDGTLKLE